MTASGALILFLFALTALASPYCCVSAFWTAEIFRQLPRSHLPTTGIAVGHLVRTSIH
jgi:hypothetical protein